MVNTEPPNLAPKGFLDDELDQVKRDILENPNSLEARAQARENFRAILGKRELSSYTTQDFTKLVELAVLAVGYGGRGITDLTLLQQLAKVVPPKITADVVFPKLVESGPPEVRRLIFYSDLILTLRVIERENGSEAEASGHAKYFGEYALFLTGIMAEMLQRSARRGGVDIPYYETAGANALKVAIKQRPVKPETTKVVHQIANNFPEHRALLNEVAASIGMLSIETLLKDVKIVQGPLHGGMGRQPDYGDRLFTLTQGLEEHAPPPSGQQMLYISPG